MCAAPVNGLRRGRLGWFRVVDVGYVGHRGHAHFLRHGRHRLGHDGRIVAAVGGEARSNVAFVVLAGFRLAEARDEGVDVPDGEVRLVADRAQGSAVGPPRGLVWFWPGLQD